MKHERTDTDGILDPCHCGARAKFICDTSHQPNSWRADCSECAETTDWVFSEDRAMVAWNKAIRSNAAGEVRRNAVTSTGLLAGESKGE